PHSATGLTELPWGPSLWSGTSRSCYSRSLPIAILRVPVVIGVRQVVVDRTNHLTGGPSADADVARQVFDALVSQTTVGFALLNPAAGGSTGARASTRSGTSMDGPSPSPSWCGTSPSASPPTRSGPSARRRSGRRGRRPSGPGRRPKRPARRPNELAPRRRRP